MVEIGEARIGRNGVNQMAIYRATAGAGFNHKTAQRVGEELEKLGEFSPHDVVQAAEQEESPLHPLFTWDDDAAAGQWRLHEARQIVNHISVLVSIDGEKQETKAFYSVPVRIKDQNTVEPRYVRVTHAVHDKAIQRTILDDLLDDMNTFTRKYEQFKAIIGAELFEVIGETIKRFSDEQLRATAARKIQKKVERQQQVAV